jgi:uroporphyrinogen-III synthase
MRFLITRPKPDADALAKQLQALGHTSWLSPVMEVICHETQAPDAKECSGLVITSRNALRCLEHHNSLAPFHDLPLFAVGKSSAAAAKRRGFTNIYQAAGRGETLPPLIAEYLNADSCAPLYYPGGKQKAFDLTPVLQEMGFELVEQIVYETKIVTTLTPEVIEALKSSGIDGVLLLSPRTAELFADLIKKYKLQDCLATASCLCLSQNVASAVEDLHWRQTLIAPHPDIDDLLDLIEQLD